MDKYRQVGARLGAYIRATTPNTQQIQALLGDLLADDELLYPMRDAVARPGFAALKPLAGTGGGTLQRDAFLQELARSYLPVVGENIGKVISGMLDFVVEQVSSETGSKQYDLEDIDPWEAAKHSSRPPWEINEGITVHDLARHLEVESERVIRFLFAKGIVVTAGQSIEPEVAILVLEELDSPGAEKVTKEHAEVLEQQMREASVRPPVRDNAGYKRLSASEICDENLWNQQRDPEMDKRFLEAWSLRWFNKRYRPRLERD